MSNPKLPIHDELETVPLGKHAPGIIILRGFIQC